MLAQAAYEANTPLFHISTDYFFDDTSSVPYKETAPVNPQSVCGASKLAGDQTLEHTLAKHNILRTSWVFGATGNNFVKTMLRLGKECNKLSVVADQHVCLTSARNIVDVLWQLAEKYAQENSLLWSVYHFSNLPACTWHEFASEIFEQAVNAEILEKASVVNAITTADYPTTAKRPAWSIMNSSKIEVLLGDKVVC